MHNANYLNFSQKSAKKSAKKSYAYSKCQRLNQKDRFIALLQTKPITKTNFFYAHAIKNDMGYARLGMIISKRFCKKAHDRNKIKRYIREYFRLNLPSLPNDMYVGIDILIRLKNTIIKPNIDVYAEYAAQLHHIFNKIVQLR